MSELGEEKEEPGLNFSRKSGRFAEGKEEEGDSPEKQVKKEAHKIKVLIVVVRQEERSPRVPLQPHRHRVRPEHR